MKVKGLVIIGIVALILLVGGVALGAGEGTGEIGLYAPQASIASNSTITIIRAHENPAVEGFCEASVHIVIEVDGYPLHIGGIDPSWDRLTLMEWLNSQHSSLLRQAMQEQDSGVSVVSRWDFVDAEALPESGHYARLDAVFVDDALKAEVARYFEGQWYIDIRCLVTLSAIQAYQAGNLEVGDYVWVYYSSDPRPGHEGESVPIVVDKVMYP